MSSQQTTRRNFLRLAGGAASALAVGVAADVAGDGHVQAATSAARASGSAQRPNILFLISDDQSWAHTGASGDRVVRTPTFDRIAREGVLFSHAFCSSPSCTPSRGAILSGQDFCRLEEGANLWSTLPAKFAVYPDLLEASGYAIGHTRKGWSPGSVEAGGRTRNAAGPRFASFETFMQSVPDDKPFCFWFGALDPHRPYEPGFGAASGLKLEEIVVPPFLPDVPSVREDLRDYYAEIERFDREAGLMLDYLQATGKLDNTLIVVTSDNGMPFPRAKTHLYDYGTRMPLAMRWPGRIPPNRVLDDFVSHIDLAPTFLEAAGLRPHSSMTGRSLLPALQSTLKGRIETPRDRVFFGRERHDTTRLENGLPVGYPCRGVRTSKYLYIRNFKPTRWPALDGPGPADSDDGPTKQWMTAHRDDPKVLHLHRLSFGLRPEEEFYDLARDPFQMHNLSGDKKYRGELKALRHSLTRWMREVADPRASSKGDVFDRYPPRRPASARVAPAPVARPLPKSGLQRND